MTCMHACSSLVLCDVDSLLFLSAPLEEFGSDTIMQNCLSTDDNTTLITWPQSSLTGNLGEYLNSNMTSETVIVDNFLNSPQDMVTARVVLPDFDRPYDVCIAATNMCGELTNTLGCTTVMINLAGTSLYSSIHCLIHHHLL